MTATEKLDRINELIGMGKTLIFSTYLKHAQVSPKAAATWKKNGWTMFKVSGNNLFMASGKKFVCIDGCKITVH